MFSEAKNPFLQPSVFEKNDSSHLARRVLGVPAGRIMKRWTSRRVAQPGAAATREEKFTMSSSEEVSRESLEVSRRCFEKAEKYAEGLLGDDESDESDEWSQAALRLAVEYRRAYDLTKSEEWLAAVIERFKEVLQEGGEDVMNMSDVLERTEQEMGLTVDRQTLDQWELVRADQGWYYYGYPYEVIKKRAEHGLEVSSMIAELRRLMEAIPDDPSERWKKVRAQDTCMRAAFFGGEDIVPYVHQIKDAFFDREGRRIVPDGENLEVDDPLKQQVIEGCIQVREMRLAQVLTMCVVNSYARNTAMRYVVFGFVNMGDFEQAQKWISKIEDGLGERAECWAQLIEERVKRGQLHEAEAALERMDQDVNAEETLRAHYVMTVAAIACAYAERGDHQRVKELISHCEAKGGDSVMIWGKVILAVKNRSQEVDEYIQEGIAHVCRQFQDWEKGFSLILGYLVQEPGLWERFHQQLCLLEPPLTPFAMGYTLLRILKSPAQQTRDSSSLMTLIEEQIARLDPREEEAVFLQGDYDFVRAMQGNIDLIEARLRDPGNGNRAELHRILCGELMKRGEISRVYEMLREDGGEMRDEEVEEVFLLLMEKFVREDDEKHIDTFLGVANSCFYHQAVERILAGLYARRGADLVIQGSREV